MDNKVRVIAFYLPQFHPIPENDEWWGKGFTEWTNVGKAKPLFRGHEQPKVPADLGYYDLRVPETREAQANLAREAGIEGFCYWHYWFGNGKRLLERPFNEVLASGKPDFPFCLAWANESWKGFAHGLTNRNLLIEQLYPGLEDYKNHFYTLLPAFKDQRYIKVDGKPLFVIYKPLADKEVRVFIDTWRKLAHENGLQDMYFVGHNNDPKDSIAEILSTGVDAVNTVRLNWFITQRSLFERVKTKLNKMIFNVPLVYSYDSVLNSFLRTEDKNENIIPTITTGWDHSPRSNREALVLTNYNPSSFEKHIKQVLSLMQYKKGNKKIIFLKSWNEWAEGNYIEPDLKFGLSFLNILNKYLNFNNGK